MHVGYDWNVNKLLDYDHSFLSGKWRCDRLGPLHNTLRHTAPCTVLLVRGLRGLRPLGIINIKVNKPSVPIAIPEIGNVY